MTFYLLYKLLKILISKNKFCNHQRPEANQYWHLFYNHVRFFPHKWDIVYFLIYNFPSIYVMWTLINTHICNCFTSGYIASYRYKIIYLNISFDLAVQVFLDFLSIFLTRLDGYYWMYLFVNFPIIFLRKIFSSRIMCQGFLMHIFKLLPKSCITSHSYMPISQPLKIS